MGEIGEMEEVLASFGVDLTNPIWLREKACGLVNAGIGHGDAERLFTHIERTTNDRDRVPGLIAALAKDPPAVIEGVKRLVAFEQAATKRALEAVGNQFGESLWQQPSPLQGEDPIVWAKDRARTIAFARHVTDRAPLATVAEEMGLSKKQVLILVEEERQRRASEQAR